MPQALLALNVAACPALLLVVLERAGMRRAPALGQLLREFAAVARDPAFWRVALCMGSS